MFVWTVANQKGGVGKTTTAVALAGLCAQLGRRVLMIDLDPQGSLTSYFRLKPEEMEFSSFTLFQERKKLSLELIQSCVQTTTSDNIGLIPAAVALATLERQAISADGMGLVMERVVELLKGQADVVIIDCPPQLGVLMINALAACQRLIMPVQTEHLALKGLERMVNTIRMMAKSRKTPLAYSIVPTMFDRRTQASITSLRALKNEYPEQIWPGKIPIDTKLRDASKAGIPPSEFAPDSRSVEAYRSLLKWLLQQMAATRKPATPAISVNEVRA